MGGDDKIDIAGERGVSRRGKRRKRRRMGEGGGGEE